MLKYLSDNLNILMAKNRLNSNGLARIVGVPATTIKRIRNNEQTNPTILTLLPIAQFFSISLDQLIGNEPIVINDKESYKKSRIHKIPLLSWQECSDYASLDYSNISNFTYTERAVSAKAYALKIEDDDLDFFPKNSILIIEPTILPASGDYVIIGNIEQHIAAVRKYIIEIDKIYLKPLVPGVDVATLTDTYKILGIVIQYKLELKL
jgi:SOS-response transcriptional repressor LexA